MLLVLVVLQVRTSSRAGVFYLLVLLLPGILLLGIWRPIRRIPASRKMGTSMCLAQQGARCRALTSRKNGLLAQAKKGRGRCALFQKACGLYQAPLRRRRREPFNINVVARLLTQTRPNAPGPGGEEYSSDRVPRGTGTARAPLHNIMYRIA